MNYLKCIVYCTVLTVVCSHHTFAQKHSYRQEYQRFGDSIKKHYYDPAAHFYKEHFPPKKDDREASYLWPLCAAFEAFQVGGELNNDFSDFEQVYAIIRKYYDRRPPANGFASYVVALGGGDRFYDDNQWIGITAMNQYEKTKDNKWLELGMEIYDYMMTGWDQKTGGGLYWQEGDYKTKNTCSNGPGIILALQIYKATGSKKYLVTAQELYNWVHTKLRTPGWLFWDNIRVEDGTVDRRIYSYNTGTMLQSAILLYEATGDNRFLKEANTIADSATGYFFGADKFVDNYWFNAVLLRAYMHLLHYNPDKKHILAVQKATDNELRAKDASGLVGKQRNKNLVPQAGMLEVLARLAVLQKQKVIE